MAQSSASAIASSRIPDVVVQYFVHRFLAGQLGSWRDITYTREAALPESAIRLAREAAQTTFLHPHVVQLLLLRAAARARPPAPGQQDMRGIIAGSQKFTLPLDLMITADEVAEVHQVMKTQFYPSLSSRSRKPIDPSDSNYDHDMLVKGMARWYKSSYMSWADPIKCRLCGSSTSTAGMGEPTDEERADGAGRVELHRCGNCGAVQRFARYGRVKALLREKRGRCGEWAHLFYVFLLAAGVQARYIWNSEDHVWCEFWSPAKKHWVHVDPSEASVDEPLLYAKGWGKKQAFCLAFGRDGCEDVTRIYVDDWPECQQRRRGRRWGEQSLRKALLFMTVRLRLAMPRERRVQLAEMDEQQVTWASKADERARGEDKELGGRTSGPAEWRAARGEAGQPVGARQRPHYRVLRTVQLLPSPSLTSMTTMGPVEARQSIRLTDGPGQTSAIFANEQTAADQSFRCVLDFRISAPDKSGEADGMALVFTREKRVGEGGFGLGYHGIGGEGDFAIEIDTYRSQDRADDPPTPHISIHSPPNAHHDYSLACTDAGEVPRLADASWILEVIYSAERRRVTVSLAEATASERLYRQMIQAELPSGGKQWFCGVTAATGGLWQIHEVEDWKLEYINLNEDDCNTPTSGTDDVMDAEA